jgi:predicted lipid carrier protein YhbT
MHSRPFADSASDVRDRARSASAMSRLPALIGALLAPLPLFPVQFLLARIVERVARRRPELFERLGHHVHSTYAIDVAELPFRLLLRANPDNPRLTAHRPAESILSDAQIAGPFMELFRVLDGRGDSDAMFFSGAVRVTGDTEAAVCLRNALDDLDGSVVEDMLEMGGPLLLPARLLLRRLRETEGGR